MFNNISLVGRIVNTPRLEKDDSNKYICNITLAVNRSYKNAEGVYDTDFIKCRLYESVAEKTCEYCRKGDLVCVKGSLSSLSGDGIYVMVNKFSYLAMGNKESD